MMPRVSVIIPSYNHERFIEQRIRTVLAQSYNDYELIYLDDASTDDSNQVALPLLNHRAAKIIINKHNGGSTFKQWNKGVAEATGEYIWFAESDDYADEHLLETLVKVLDENKNVGLAYCQSLAVNESDEVLFSLNNFTSDLDSERWSKDFINDGKDECRRFLFLRNTIPNASAVLFRKSLFNFVGGADESYKINGDWLLWVKLLMNSDVGFVAHHHNYYRFHQQTVRHTTLQTLNPISEGYSLRKLILNNTTVAAEAKRNVFYGLMNQWEKNMLMQISKRNFNLKSNVEMYRMAAEVDTHIKRRFFRVGASIIKNQAKTFITKKILPSGDAGNGSQG